MCHTPSDGVLLLIHHSATTRGIKTDTEALLDDAAELKASRQRNTDTILVEIAALRAQLPDAQDEAAAGTGMILQKYLDNMTTYAEIAVLDPSQIRTQNATTVI